MDFIRPAILTVFLEVCVEFAGFDIFDAGNWFDDNFEYIETDALNDSFEFNGIDNKIMLINSGSFFVMQIIIIVEPIIFWSINKFATYFPNNHHMRALGIKFYVDDPLGEIYDNS